MKFLIDFYDDSLQNDIDNYLADNNCEIDRIFDRLGKIYLVTSSSTPPDSSIVERINEDQSFNLSLGGITESVTVSEDNWWKIVSYDNGEIITDETTEIDIDISDSHMDVYVVDSGINKNHTEFVGQSINDLYTVSPGNFTDSEGHGTALASLITGNTCAITRANIQNVKVYHNNGTLTLAELLDALNAILEHSNSRPDVLSIMNVSWIMEYNNYVNQKIEYMISQGIIVVVCAGNQGKSIADLTPASIPGVYTVGSYDQDFIPADFSNYTSSVGSAGGDVNSGALDIWAPGVGIRVADSSVDTNNFKLVNGTSYSAAVFTACLCYNLTGFEKLWSEEFGEPLSKLTASSEGFLGLNKQKTGLLDLKPPHQNSINKIATFMQNGNSTIKLWWQQRKGFITPEYSASDSVQIMKLLFLDSDVASYQFTEGNLPQGLKISNGHLVGSLPALQNDSPIKLHKFTIECLSHDQSVTTLEYSLMLKDKNKVDDLTTDEIQDLDSEIQILLQGSCDNFGSPPCVDDCPPGEFCFGTKTFCTC